MTQIELLQKQIAEAIMLQLKNPRVLSIVLVPGEDHLGSSMITSPELDGFCVVSNDLETLIYEGIVMANRLIELDQE